MKKMMMANWTKTAVTPRPNYNLVGCYVAGDNFANLPKRQFVDGMMSEVVGKFFFFLLNAFFSSVAVLMMGALSSLREYYSKNTPRYHAGPNSQINWCNIFAKPPQTSPLSFLLFHSSPSWQQLPTQPSRQAGSDEVSAKQG